ncbi:hypothetical protein [Micromonospora sp. NPDC050200]|uniref:hypothetical protein n=1 Tax=Micromonospora sp. NPDC050200 TaxID=3155664 RepID=UPI0034028BB5
MLLIASDSVEHSMRHRGERAHGQVYPVIVGRGDADEAGSAVDDPTAGARPPDWIGDADMLSASSRSLHPPLGVRRYLLGTSFRNEQRPRRVNQPAPPNPGEHHLWWTG